MWPNNNLEPLCTITPASPESGVFNAPYNGGNVGLNGYASAAWSGIAANTAVFIPFSVAKRITFTTLFIVNGATVSGNVDVGIYDSNGTLIVSKGSTAQAGASALQKFTVTSTTIGPGVYYLAVVFDNTTGTIYKTIIGQALRTKLTGMAQMASAFPLPATVTFATIGQDFVPMVGLSVRSSI